MSAISPRPLTPATQSRPAFALAAIGFACLTALVLAIATVGQAAEKAGNDSGKNEPGKAESTGSAEDSFDGQIAAAWQALAHRDVAAAKTAIATAGKLAAGADQKKEAAQMLYLAGSIEQFWRDVDAELKRLQPGDELELRGTKVGVVESKADSLTLHIEGKNQKKSRAALPGRWALALAEHRFDNSPANKRKLGAFLAVDPQGDRQQARKVWKEAQRGEPAAGELLALLDSANIPAPVGGKETDEGESDQPKLGAMPLAGEPAELPSKDKLTAAGKRVKETYATEIRGAKSPERKLELSKTLIKAGSDSDDDQAFRLALFRQALDLAAGAGDQAVIEETIDTMKHFFKIDVWEVNAEACTRAATAAKAPAVGDVVRLRARAARKV